MHTVVKHDLASPFQARVVRLIPSAFNNHMSMRWELYGCQGIGITILLQTCITNLDHTTCVFCMNERVCAIRTCYPNTPLCNSCMFQLQTVCTKPLSMAHSSMFWTRDLIQTPSGGTLMSMAHSAHGCIKAGTVVVMQVGLQTWITSEHGCRYLYHV